MKLSQVVYGVVAVVLVFVCGYAWYMTSVNTATGSTGGGGHFAATMFLRSSSVEQQKAEHLSRFAAAKAAVAAVTLSEVMGVPALGVPKNRPLRPLARPGEAAAAAAGGSPAAPAAAEAEHQHREEEADPDDVDHSAEARPTADPVGVAPPPVASPAKTAPPSPAARTVAPIVADDDDDGSDKAKRRPYRPPRIADSTAMEPYVRDKVGRTGETKRLPPPKVLPYDDTRPPLTAEEAAANAEILLEYRRRRDARLQQWRTEGFVEPRFCRKNGGNPLCEDGRTDRAMYEKRRKRFSDPAYTSGFPQRDCSAGPLVISISDHKIRSWWSHVINPMEKTIGECSVPCTVRDGPGADILYSMVQPSPKHGGSPHQRTAIISLESYKGHEGQNINEALADSADIVMSYSRKADVWVNYWYGLTGDNFDNCKRDDCLAEYPPNIGLKRQLHPTALSPLFVSNCHSGRGQYLEELMKYSKIDSYGGCFGTPGLPRAEQGRLPKQKLSREYRFHLAFENSILDDYVTEKLFDAWSYGAIPVYWGAPNAELYAPAVHSFINALDFDSPKELGAYLNALDRNDTAYMEFFDWRRTQHPYTAADGSVAYSALPPAFWAMSDNNFTNRGGQSMLCKLCELYHSRYCSNRKKK